MAKIKERKSESWKPPGIHQDDGFISKNKKRKDKRMSLNLSAKKIDTEEFIPIKKSSLLPFNKAKKSAGESFHQTPNKFQSPGFNKQKQTPKKKENLQLTPKGKKENSFVLTPGAKKFSIGNVGKGNTPTGKKQNNTPSKITGTPKKLNDIVIKSAIKKKAEEFIDSEAEEGEEPIIDKDVKPYVKGDNKRKKSISFKFDTNEDSNGESEDDDDAYGSTDDSDEDSDEALIAKNYIDEEASEGEETDDDDDDDDEDDSCDDFKDFMIKDEDEGSDDEEEGSDDGEEESDEDDTSDDDDVKLPIKTENLATIPVKKSVPIANGTKSLKLEKVKEGKVLVEKKPKAGKQVAEKKPKVEKQNAKQTVTSEISTATSKYVGFVRELPKNVTDQQIRSQLATVINAKNIISITIKITNKKNVNCLIYVSDEDSLEKLLNKEFAIGNSKFKVYKARENPTLVKDQPVAFLPRVPLSISNEKLKATIEADIGPGKVVALKSKKVAEKFQTRNVLLTVSDEETLKKIIYKGGYVCDGTEVIIRQAYESGFKVPVYKVVFSEIPENTTEAILKKTIESSLGKGTVIHVKFSFRKNTFAFVTLKTEEAQKKALEIGNDVSIKNSKLKVLEYRPRLPKKRGPSKKKDAPIVKKQKTENQNQTSETVSPEAKKVKKQKSKTPQTTKNKKPLAKVTIQSSPKVNQPNAQKKNVQNSPKKNKNKNAKNVQTAIPDKKADLSKKIEGKKNKPKEKKFKKKKKAGDD